MIGWIFGSFTKKIERSANKVSENFVKVTGKELRQLAEEWDYVAQRRVKESIVEAENLKNKILGDIEYLLNHADTKVRHPAINFCKVCSIMTIAYRLDSIAN